jgi:hypothetical protein
MNGWTGKPRRERGDQLLRDYRQAERLPVERRQSRLAFNEQRQPAILRAMVVATRVVVVHAVPRQWSHFVLWRDATPAQRNLSSGKGTYRHARQGDSGWLKRSGCRWSNHLWGFVRVIRLTVTGTGDGPGWRIG